MLDTITARLMNDTLTAEDREGLARLVWAVQGAEGVSASVGAAIPGEWQAVAEVVSVLG